MCTVSYTWLSSSYFCIYYVWTHHKYLLVQTGNALGEQGRSPQNHEVFLQEGLLDLSALTVKSLPSFMFLKAMLEDGMMF